MAIPPPKRRRLLWTAPKSLLATLIFAAVTILLQYFIVTLTTSSGGVDQTALVIPVVNGSISLLFHLLPVAVTATLIASFIYLTGQVTALSRAQPLKKPPPSSPHAKPKRLTGLGRVTRSIRRAARRVKQRILKPSDIASFQRRIAPASAMIKSALIVAATFTILVTLVAVAAYPHIVHAAAVGLHTGNAAFHGFVTATIQLSQSLASAVPPLGAAAAAVNDALLAVSPGFRRTLESAASFLTAGLVALSPVDKYLAIQNAALWTTAIVTLLYKWYGSFLRRRW